ncbi:hypothetical protein [Nitrospirillum viridazoti]|uniref:Uncharacterized protein n=1 Tax=Nitrospirillum viridazoti CBAmc TaxID=1441467 RepID=A0A248JRL9_9PROT|nr:hypothetical protein [Nitrospirillum amazonense]ASG21393.1 hypothetical protein Y958_11560 [Nitrospirillum amazonense CBAmc]TWB33070.1 hypothetical protein FBZ91_115132 [Nitrospirillum amazonense]
MSTAPFSRWINCTNCLTTSRYGVRFCRGCRAPVEYGQSDEEAMTCFKVGWIGAAALTFLLHQTSCINLHNEIACYVAAGLVAASGFVVATAHLYLTIDRVRFIPVK